MDIKQKVFDIIDNNKDEWNKVLATVLRKTITEFGRLTYDEINKNAPIRKKDTKAFDPYRTIINSYITNYVKNAVISISDTSKEKVADEIEKGFNKGLGVSFIVENITNRLEDNVNFRSELITRNSIVSASNYGSIEGALQNELRLKKVWLPVRDDSTRESHLNMLDHPAIDLNDSFSVGDGLGMYPGDPSLPPEEFMNCRCAIGYEYV